MSSGEQDALRLAKGLRDGTLLLSERDEAAEWLERLHAENEALREQNEAQRDEWLAWDAKRKDLERDAGRYRWLRKALADRSKNGRSHHFCSIAEGRPEDLDEAIDAMKGQP